MKKALVAALLISVVLLSSFAFAVDESVTGKVVIYTSIYPDIITLITPWVEEEFPNLEVEWFQGGTEKIVSKLAAEMQAGKVQADIIMVADPSYYRYLQSIDMLIPYKSKEFDNVVVDKDPDGYWTTVRVCAGIIAYNTNLVTAEEAPKSFKDLLDPKWKNQLAMPSPLLSGSAYVEAGTLKEMYGWDYFEELRKNGIMVEDGNGAVGRKIIGGEYKVGIILEENILKYKETGEPVEISYPVDGPILVPSPIAIMKGAKNLEACQAMVDWWLTAKGQEAIVSGWMHGVRADSLTPKYSIPMNELLKNCPKSDWDDLAFNQEEIKDTFSEIVLE